MRVRLILLGAFVLVVAVAACIWGGDGDPDEYYPWAVG